MPGLGKRGLLRVADQAPRLGATITLQRFPGRSLEVDFQRENILLFKLNARQTGHRDPEIRSFYRDLEKHLAAIPGVRSACMANSPLISEGARGWPMVPVGKERPEKAPSAHGAGAARTATRVLGTGARFFSTMHIPLLWFADERGYSWLNCCQGQAEVRIFDDNDSRSDSVFHSSHPTLLTRSARKSGACDAWISFP
jgi:hypothetical protein